MTLDEYQMQAATTAIYSGREQLPGLVYCALGLGGESGEIDQLLKRVLRDHQGVVSDALRARIADELGDVLWYVARLANEIGRNLSEIAAANLDKLARRELQGKLQGEGGDR